MGIGYLLWLNPIEDTIVIVFILITPGLLVFSALVYGEALHKIPFYAVHYLLMMPTYVNILSIYSITQTDDLTWGTRPGSSQHHEIKDLY